MANREWKDGEMRDGIRKVRNARASKAAGKNVFSFKVPYRDANGKQTSETFAAFKDAVAFRNKIRAKRDEGLVIDPKAGAVSLTDYAGTWLDGAKGKRPGTYAIYEGNLRLHILPALGGQSLRAITRADVQNMVNALTAHGMAPRTVHGVYKTLVAVMRSAHLLDKRIAVTPCVRITLPEIPDDEVHALTVAQVRALALAMPDRYRAAVWVAAGTGLRVSEVLALTWDRIDLEAGTIKVDRQLNARRQFAPVKTRRSKRVVPLPETVAGVLRAHKTLFPPTAQTVPHTSGESVTGALLVFTRPAGEPVCGNDLRGVFRLARARAGLPDAVTFHTLRHTYASLQIAAGTPLTALQERMGHGSIKVTSDTYGHLYPHEDDRTKAAIDRAFATDDDPGDDGPAGALVAA